MKNRLPWKIAALQSATTSWLERQRSKLFGVSENSLWWDLLYRWSREAESRLTDWIDGKHRFSPVRRYEFPDETVDSWEHPDRMMVSLLHQHIKPTFKHLISSHCLHLKGPNGVKTALGWLQNALSKNNYRYIIRADIKGYYASIDRRILSEQLKDSFDDPRVLHYLDGIVNSAIDKRGHVFVPKKGIHRRSATSPFFGALYLTPLDRAFEKRAGTFYLRFMDDIVVLAQTKRQFCAAKKRLFRILQDLKLTLSPKKTRLGKLHDGFHFLGAKLAVSQNPASSQIQHTTVTMHDRSRRRALDHARAMKADSVHPETIKRYVIKWSRWWNTALRSETQRSILEAWAAYARIHDSYCAWIGQFWLSLAAARART